MYSCSAFLTKMRHALQPKHIKLSEKEKKKLLAKYNISELQLPKIKRDDAGLVKDVKDAKPGDVIKIIRKGNVTYYRVVV